MKQTINDKKVQCKHFPKSRAESSMMLGRRPPEAEAVAVQPGAADADEEAEHPSAPEADAEAVAIAKKKTTGLQITTSLNKVDPLHYGFLHLLR